LVDFKNRRKYIDENKKERKEKKTTSLSYWSIQYCAASFCKINAVTA
jgi:hypothetical protein